MTIFQKTAAGMPIEKLIIRGNEVTPFAPVSSGENLVTLQRSFVIETGGTRGTSNDHSVDLTDQNMIELVFDDSTVWFSGPSSLAEIFPSASVQNRSADGGFILPGELESSATERGIVGKVALKLVNIFVKPVVQGDVKELAKALERKQLDNRIGLLRLDADFNYQPFTAENTSL